MEYNDYECRVCLGHNVIVNWNELINESSEVTYKDIYYKYTQLEMQVPDPYTPMLCETCSIDLKIAHLLVKKALESDYVLHQTNLTDTQIKCNEKLETPEKIDAFEDVIEDEEKYDPNFEVLLFEQHHYESSIDGHKDEEDNVITKTQTLNENLKQKQKKRRIVKNTKCLDIPEDINSKSALQNQMSNKKILMKKSLQKPGKNKELSKANTDNSTDYYEHSSSKDELNYTGTYSKNNETVDFQNINNEDISIEDSIIDNNNSKIFKKSEKISQNYLTNIQNNNSSNTNEEHKDSQDNPSFTLTKHKYVYPKKTYMCSKCPKTYKCHKLLLQHEESHKEHRERSVVCPECGTKFFFKSDLKLHSVIHKKDREKKFKCEYCDKAYYGRGSLNVHRREHLGNMLPCSMCSKKYHRQVDLDRHNRVAHSEVPLFSELKKAPKYVVYCKECDKTVSTISWAAHQANHLKTPLMACSLCEKDFFRRSTCTYHMDKVHNFKKREEYEQFIIYHKRNRMSHLFIQQQAMLQTIEN